MTQRIMWTSSVAGILILIGCVFLVLGTLPMQTKIEDDKLTVKFVIGKTVIDLKDAHFFPVPDEVNHNIIRVGGSSIGKKHSGNFMNTKTRTRYKFFLTGHGERVYFEIGDKKYLVDGLSLTTHQ